MDEDPKPKNPTLDWGNPPDGMADRLAEVERKIERAESWIKAEQTRRDSYRPPAPNDVRTALVFAAALQEEHEEGKLTDAERSAVVLAGALQQIVRLWETYRDDDPAWFQKFTAAIERVKR